MCCSPKSCAIDAPPAAAHGVVLFAATLAVALGSAAVAGSGAAVPWSRIDVSRTATGAAVSGDYGVFVVEYGTRTFDVRVNVTGFLDLSAADESYGGCFSGLAGQDAAPIDWCEECDSSGASAFAFSLFGLLVAIAALAAHAAAWYRGAAYPRRWLAATDLAAAVLFFVATFAWVGCYAAVWGELFDVDVSFVDWRDLRLGAGWYLNTAAACSMLCAAYVAFAGTEEAAEAAAERVAGLNGLQGGKGQTAEH